MLEVSTLVLALLALLGSFFLLFMLAGAVWLAAQGVRAHVLPHFHSSPADLVERFGSWAGRCQCAAVCSSVCSMITLALRFQFQTVSSRHITTFETRRGVLGCSNRRN